MLTKFWMAAALSVATLGAQSAADEINKGLPAWLRVGGESRARAEGFENRGFAPEQGDAYLLTRIRVNLKVQPVSGLKFFFQSQDVRAFFNQRIPNASPYENPMDLRQGYVELGDSDKQPVAVRAGRQEINFGEQRLVGSSNWSNAARTFDAVRVTFRYRGIRLDAFAASVVNPNPAAFDRPATGNNLHGVYGTVEKLVPRSTVEPYFYWRLAPRQTAEDGARANLDFKTIGIRWVMRPAGGIDAGAEMAGQTGSLGPDAVRSWAGHWVAGYTLAALTWKPRLSAEYNYAAGDKDPHDGVRGTFDTLYPTPHDKYGLCDQVGWRNIHDVRLGVNAAPTKKLAAIANYHDWWLASPRDALYAANGSLLVRNPAGAAGAHVGQEADLQAAYTVSRQMQLAGGIGHIFPGEFLKKSTPGKGYTFPFLMLSYTF